MRASKVADITEGIQEEMLAAMFATEPTFQATIRQGSLYLRSSHMRNAAAACAEVCVPLLENRAMLVL